MHGESGGGVGWHDSVGGWVARGVCGDPGRGGTGRGREGEGKGDGDHGCVVVVVVVVGAAAVVVVLGGDCFWHLQPLFASLQIAMLFT